MDDSIVEKFISLTMLNTIYISNFVLNRSGARVFLILIDFAIAHRGP